MCGATTIALVFTWYKHFLVVLTFQNNVLKWFANKNRNHLKTCARVKYYFYCRERSFCEKKKGE